MKSAFIDLKDLADIVESGINCADCSGSVSGLFGSVDIVSSTLTILPAGLNSYWKQGDEQLFIKGEVKLGDKCTRNFMTKDLRLSHTSQLLVNDYGSCSFTLDMIRRMVT